MWRKHPDFENWVTLVEVENGRLHMRTYLDRDPQTQIRYIDGVRYEFVTQGLIEEDAGAGRYIVGRRTVYWRAA